MLVKRCLLVLLLSFLSLSCTKKEQKAEYGLALSETLRINILQEPPSLDWTKSSDTTSSLIENNIMEGLTEYNLEDPELGLMPGLATEWKSTPDGKTWTFVLRQGVKWTDGVEFNGTQIIDSWERLLNPSTASVYSYFLFGIKNAQAYNQGKIKDFSQVGVKVTAEGHLIVELEKSKSYFPYLLTHHSTFPIRKDLIKKYGDKWVEAENMVTLGAYKLKIWEHDKAIVLEANENYYGQKPKVKNILAYMINEMTTAINLFDSEKLDIQYTLPSRELRQLRQRKDYREGGILGTYYYGFNTRIPPFSDARVRRAFALGIDRKQITDLLAGGQIPLSGWIPAGMFGYETERGLKFDLEKANKLLDEAGFKDRSQFPRVKLAFNTSEDHQRVAENVQAQLKKNLGIEIELGNEEWKVYLSSLKSNTPSIYRLGWVADYPDPDNFMNLMASYSDNNYTGWKNKKYDQLIERAVGLSDKEVRRKVYSEAQKLLVEEEVPVWPIYSMVSQILIQPRVKGFKENALQRYIFKTVSLQ